jgi:hypothetical protein
MVIDDEGKPRGQNIVSVEAALYMAVIWADDQLPLLLKSLFLLSSVTMTYMRHALHKIIKLGLAIICRAI